MSIRSWVLHHMVQNIMEPGLWVFNSLSYVEGHKILSTNIIKDLYFSVKTALEAERFDGIAWGLQEHLEQILVAWVENSIKETSIKDVVLSGEWVKISKPVKGLLKIPAVIILGWANLWRWITWRWCCVLCVRETISRKTAQKFGDRISRHRVQ